MAIEISPDDVTRAEEFIASLLTDNVPEGRYTKGTALRDLTVKAFAFIFAHLQKENAQVRSLQSLLNVQALSTTADPETDRSVAIATDAILSNWFLKRKIGEFSRGLITVVVGRKQDYLIRRNQRFQYNTNLFFFPDTDADPIIINSNQLITVFNSSGQIEGYQFTLRVIAAKTGKNYDVAPAEWVDTGSFSPFTLRVFSTDIFTSGKNRESTTDLITRANTAIAVRNLINDRSIDATLRDRFSTVNRLQVIGMGDPEMQRDKSNDVSSFITLHLGGHYDVYVEMPITQKTYEGQLGSGVLRPDGRATVFKDASILDWTATAVQVGDAIKIIAGLPEIPQDFVVKQILVGELRISEGGPFTVATDLDGTFVEYFIYRPLFGANFQVLPLVGTNLQGQTSSTLKNVGRLLLPAGPHYDIIDVAITDPNTGDPAINDVDGYIHFNKRVNIAPAPITIASEDAEYQIVSSNIGNAQSALVYEEIILHSDYNGKTIRVQYDTLAGFSTVHDFTVDRFERVLAGNILLKGFHPVYLTIGVSYALKASATKQIDETALINSIVDYITTFPPDDVIDTSDITTLVKNFDTNIGTVFPLTIYYDSILPDGRIVSYVTTDAVSLDPLKLEPEFVGLVNDPLSLGISDRTVRYLTNARRITVGQVNG